MTTDRTRRRAAFDAAQTAALVIAIAAGLAATFDDVAVRVLTLGFVTVGLLGWRYPLIRVGLAVVAVMVLMADAVGTRPTDRTWIQVALVALVLAAVLGSRASLLAMRPFGDDARATRAASRPATVVGTAVVLAVLAVVGFAIGPDLAIAESRRDGGPDFALGDGDIRPPDDGATTGGALAPYLGFDQTLDTSARGDLGDEVVLRVEADAPDFWRGQSFDRWDGRTWTRSRLTPAFTVSAQRGVPAGDIPLEPLEQRFRVEAPAIGEVFAAYRPVVVGLPFHAWEFGPDGSVELQRPLGRGSEYTVTSMRAMVTPDLLRRHDPMATDGSGPAAAMEGPVSDRVARLARRITADAPTTYDAIRAIESWMAANTEYTTDIPPLPRGADAVEQHLFEDRRGFCVQIATSSAAMLHSLGVPVRLGVGFVPGEASLLGRNFTVRGSDAHAWIEVWFPGIGWQAFDPTADVPLAGEYDASLGARLLRLVRRMIVPIVLLGLAAAAVLTVWIVRRRRRRVVPSWVEEQWRRIEKEGRARGRPRDPSETPSAYLAALAAGPLPAPEPLAVVAEVLTAAAYGPGAVTAADRARAEAAWAVAVTVPPPPRARRRRAADTVGV